MTTHDPLSDVAVVVVNFGRGDLLEQGLTEVARDLAPAQVVVVDNYSTESARRAVRALCRAHGWAGVFPESNTGFGTGCNLGAEVALDAGAQHLLFLNPDAVIDRESARLLLAAVTADCHLLAAPTLVASSGRILSAGTDLDLETGQMSSWLRRGDRPRGRTMAWVSGACFMVSDQLWTKVGGFDDDYFLYWEDVDLCAKVQAAGGTVGIVDGATAVHDPGQTHTAPGARAKSSTYYYFNVRNRAVFGAKWLSDDRRMQWQRTAPRAAYQVILRGGRRQLLRPFSPLTAAWRGLVDGRRESRRLRAGRTQQSFIE